MRAAITDNSVSDSRKRVAVLQSNYIPWKGYFDLIGMVDEFILYDDAQYTRRDWRNRNIIKTPNGPLWLTIPVQIKGKYHQKIKDTIISDLHWNTRHWDTIVHNYSRALYFEHYREFFRELYLGATEKFLSAINFRFISAICGILEIQTKITWSMDYDIGGGKTDKLLDLCLQVGATEYLSGPTARGYINERLFEDAGIELSWMSYDNYREYGQLFPPFEHHVSIIDLIFNEGPRARGFMKA